MKTSEPAENSVSVSQPSFLKKRMVLMISVIFLVILISVGIIILSTPKKRGEITKNTDSNRIKLENEDIEDLEPYVSESVPSIQKYSGPYFKLEYPKDWNARTVSASGSGIVVYFKPNNIGKGHAPISVQVAPVVPGYPPLQDYIIKLSSQGLTQDMAVFNGQNVLRWSGVLQAYSAKDPKITKQIQITYILFTKNDKIYIIEYSYTNDKKEASLKKSVDEILDSLEI